MKKRCIVIILLSIFIAGCESGLTPITGSATLYEVRETADGNVTENAIPKETAAKEPKQITTTILP